MSNAGVPTNPFERPFEDADTNNDDPDGAIGTNDENSLPEHELRPDTDPGGHANSPSGDSPSE